VFRELGRGEILRRVGTLNPGQCGWYPCWGNREGKEDNTKQERKNQEKGEKRNKGKDRKKG
jgi:hypothetical protein